MNQLKFPKSGVQKKKRKGLNRVRKTPIAALQRLLDRLVKDYVIMRDKKCICCGTKENLTPGHLITRGCKSVRWDLTNVFAQCGRCNYMHEFRPEIMTQEFIKRYGNDAYNALVDRSRQVRKWTRVDLEAIKQGLEGKLS